MNLEALLPASQSCFGSTGNIHLQQEEKFIFYYKKKSGALRSRAGYFISIAYCRSQAPGAFITHPKTNTCTKIKMKHGNRKV